MTEAPERLLAGEIGKPHGTSGEVYLVAISDDPTRFDAGSRLTHDDARELTVEASRRHRDRLLVKFEGVETRSDAERLRGRVYVTADDLRALEEGEYWQHDLVGCIVVDPNGRSLGEVTRVVPGSAQDLIAVETPAGERLVPVVKDIVVDVDVASRRITIDAPAGLLD